MTDKSTVYIVDDDPRARESLRWMLDQANFRVKAFPSAQAFLDYLPCRGKGLPGAGRADAGNGRPGIATEPPRSQGSLADHLHDGLWRCADVRSLAFRNGATDFLEKPVNDKVLLQHIERLIAQEGQRRDASGVNGFGDRLSLLTPTESEVLEALIEGKSIKEIARARKVSVQTVWRHQMNIFHKIGVDSHIELVRVATEWQFQHAAQAPITDR